MSDSDLERKLVTLAERSGFTGDAAALIDAVWSLDRLPDAGERWRGWPLPRRGRGGIELPDSPGGLAIRKLLALA